MKRLQVLLNNEWQYVFCRHETTRDPITTLDKMKAIRGDNHSLNYFQNFYGNYTFRII